MTRNGKPKLSVFKGREAKLNKVILLILGKESPLNIRQVYKRVRAYKSLYHTKYRVVNRRIKTLEKEGFLEQIRTERTPEGLLAKLYQPTSRTYLALALSNVNLNDLISFAGESEIIAFLAILTTRLNT